MHMGPLTSWMFLIMLMILVVSLVYICTEATNRETNLFEQLDDGLDQEDHQLKQPELKLLVFDHNEAEAPSHQKPHDEPFDQMNYGG